MDNAVVRYYEFGEFRLDARRRILLKDGEQITLSARTCDLLLILIQNEGRLLSHNDLLDAVWEGTFVEQNNLKKCISTLRQILGEKPNESHFIKTVPRRGYTFVAPVRTVSDVPDEEVLVRTTETEIVVEQIEIDDVCAETPETKSLPAAAKTWSRYKLPLVAIGVLILCSMAYAVWYSLSPKPISFSLENVKIQRLTNGGIFFASVISPDGNYLVHLTNEEKGAALNIHQVASGSSSKLVFYPHASFWSYVFTPDGNFVYYVLKKWDEPEKTGIYKVPFLGGDPKLIYRSQGGGGLSFSPDGKLLAFMHHDQNDDPAIIVMNADGSDARPLKSFPGTRIWSLRFTPDGSSILYSIRREISDQRTMYRVGEVRLADGIDTVWIPEQEKVIIQAVWMPDKASMVLLVREPNAEIRQLWQYFPASGDWRRITNDDYSYSGPTFARDGNAIISTRENSTSSISTAEGEAFDFRQIIGALNRFGHCGWTADGRLVFVSIENNSEVISIMSAAGRSKQQLTSGNDGMWLQPTVSGDGRSIVFVSNRSGTQQLWQMGLDGEDPRVLTSSTTSIFVGKLLSDNRTLIYQKYTNSKGWQLFRQVGDGEPELIVDLLISYWDVSPDEKSLAIFVEDPSTKKWNAVVMNLADGTIIRNLNLADSRGQPRWTRDGKSLTYIAGMENTSEIIQIPIDGTGPPKTLTSATASEPFTWFDWSPDGKRLVVIRSKNFADAVIITAGGQ